jgi:hypothetical protein
LADDRPRTEPAGLSALSLRFTFENGIMSLPQIFAGRNTVRVSLNGEAPARPLTVAYRYRTNVGEKVHSQRLEPSAFRNGEASYVLDAPGLIRCESVRVTY